MTHKERVLAAVEHRKPDRTPLWIGWPKPETLEKLYKFYGVADKEQLLRCIGDDIRWFGGPPWKHPEGKPYFDPYLGMPQEQRSHAAPGVFADCTDVKQVEDYPWPDPQYVDCEGLRETLEPYQEYAILGGSWAPFFHDVANFFGMENYFIKMYTDPEVVEAVTEHIIEFYIAANEKIFTVAGDLIDGFFFGNDYGTQNDLFMSLEMWRRFILPYEKALVDHAKSFGLKVFHHSCGAVSKIIPYLIEIGVDVLHPVQVEARGMEPETLAAKYRDQMTFMGGISTQQLLLYGTPQQVRENVRYMKRLFGNGYIVSPAHEAILPNIPVENLYAMFDEAVQD